METVVRILVLPFSGMRLRSFAEEATRNAGIVACVVGRAFVNKRVNLAARCGGLHRLEEGIYAAEAAVVDLRALADRHPARYESDLARALVVLGGLLVESGDILAGAKLLTEVVLLSLGREDIDDLYDSAASALRAAYRTAPDEVTASWTTVTGLPISSLIQPGD